MFSKHLLLWDLLSDTRGIIERLLLYLFSLMAFYFLSSFTTTTTSFCGSQPAAPAPACFFMPKPSHFGLYEFTYNSSHMCSFPILSVGEPQHPCHLQLCFLSFPPFLNHKTSPDSQMSYAARLHSSQEEEEPFGLTDGKLPVGHSCYMCNINNLWCFLLSAWAVSIFAGSSSTLCWTETSDVCGTCWSHSSSWSVTAPSTPMTVGITDVTTSHILSGFYSSVLCSSIHNCHTCLYSPVHQHDVQLAITCPGTDVLHHRWRCVPL